MTQTQNQAIFPAGPPHLRIYKTRFFARVATFLFPALALLAGMFYQLMPTLYAAVGWPGPPMLSGLFFNVGEALVILSVVMLWWVYGRGVAWHIWLLALMPGLLFTLSFLRDPAMTGIMAIWSSGLTLFLPWPMYAVALWLVGIIVLGN